MSRVDSVFHRWLTLIFHRTSCSCLCRWVKPIGIGVVGKIFHPTEDKPEEGPLLCGPARSSHSLGPGGCPLPGEGGHTSHDPASCSWPVRWSRGVMGTEEQKAPLPLEGSGVAAWAGALSGHTHPVNTNRACALTAICLNPKSLFPTSQTESSPHLPESWSCLQIR